MQDFWSNLNFLLEQQMKIIIIIYYLRADWAILIRFLPFLYRLPYLQTERTVNSIRNLTSITRGLNMKMILSWREHLLERVTGKLLDLISPLLVTFYSFLSAQGPIFKFPTILGHSLFYLFVLGPLKWHCFSALGCKK